MRRLTIFTAALALLAAVGACGQQTHLTRSAAPRPTPWRSSSGATSSATTPAAGAPDDAITAIQAVGERVAVAVGDGVIVRTDDAGRSWQRDWTGAEILTAVDMLSADIGWAAGDGRLLRTTNGRTWRAVSAFPVGSVHFVDDAAGFGVRGSSLVQTTDGGASWVPIRTPITPLASTANDRRGLWIADADSVWHSSDDGVTWVPLVSGVPPSANFVTEVGYSVVSLQAAGGDGVWAEFSAGEGAAFQQPWVLYGGSAVRGVRCLGEFDARGVCPGDGLDGSTYPPAISVLDPSHLEIAEACPACTTAMPVGVLTITSPNLVVRGRAPVIAPLSMSFGTPAVGYLVARDVISPAGTDVITATHDGGRTWSTPAVA